MSGSREYATGYGRPPLANQFQKGKSGNPSGRPKGRRSVSAVIAAALSERVTVTINGKKRSISKLEAAFTQQANKAAAGDRHAAKLLIEVLHQSEIRDDARANAPLDAEAVHASDAAFLEAFRVASLSVIPEGASDDQAA
jgi:predicted DNA-binding ribbon-helix-helix protein